MIGNPPTQETVSYREIISYQDYFFISYHDTVNSRLKLVPITPGCPHPSSLSKGGNKRDLDLASFSEDAFLHVPLYPERGLRDPDRAESRDPQFGLPDPPKCVHEAEFLARRLAFTVSSHAYADQFVTIA